jgi:hypothetical protein
MTKYKKAHEIFDKWEKDKTYEMGLRNDQKYEIHKIYAKDIDEARRLSGFWLTDSGRRKEGWKVQYVLPAKR